MVKIEMREDDPLGLNSRRAGRPGRMGKYVFVAFMIAANGLLAWAGYQIFSGKYRIVAGDQPEGAAVTPKVAPAPDQPPGRPRIERQPPVRRGGGARPGGSIALAPKGNAKASPRLEPDELDSNDEGEDTDFNFRKKTNAGDDRGEGDAAAKRKGVGARRKGRAGVPADAFSESGLTRNGLYVTLDVEAEAAETWQEAVQAHRKYLVFAMRRAEVGNNAHVMQQLRVEQATLQRGVDDINTGMGSLPGAKNSAERAFIKGLEGSRTELSQRMNANRELLGHLGTQTLNPAQMSELEGRCRGALREYSHAVSEARAKFDEIEAEFDKVVADDAVKRALEELHKKSPNVKIVKTAGFRKASEILKEAERVLKVQERQ